MNPILDRRKSPQQLKDTHRQYNTKRISMPQFDPIPMDIKLASNPFLNNNQQFQYLIHKIKEYNKNILNKSVKDSYEQSVHEKLFSMLAILSNFHTRQIQIERLAQLYKWYEQQVLLIKQRAEQGQIRYKINTSEILQGKKLDKSELKEVKEQEVNSKKNTRNLQLISSKIKDQAKAYKNNWRTVHKELETPDKRLKKYKTKQISIIPLTQAGNEEKKAPRITYPKMERVKWIRDDMLDELNQLNEQLDNKDPANQEGMAVQNPENNQAAQKQKEKQKLEQEQQQAADLGLGQPVEEEQPQEQEQPQEDKLRPRILPYVREPYQPTNKQLLSQNSMKNKYLEIQHKSITKNIQQKQIVKMMHSWGLRRSQLDREVQRRIQNMGLNMRYSLSYEDPEPVERINPEDEQKFGFSALYRTQKKKEPNLDLSVDFQLPKIKNKSAMYQKSIRNNRLESLKKKFGKLLNLSDNYEEREVNQSMCHYQFKKRGFSQILRRNSKSKQRINQLDQVASLKEKLAKKKINIDMKSLSMALAIPEDEQSLPTQAILTKQLPSNPFWVEPKKKKKKK